MLVPPAASGTSACVRKGARRRPGPLTPDRIDARAPDVGENARRPLRPGSARMTLLADVVAVSEQLASTSSRSAKIALLAGLLRVLEEAEVPVAVGLLSGVPRQGRIGVGYRTVSGIEGPPAKEASLTIGDLDRALVAVQEATGSGSAAVRRELLSTCSATPSRPNRASSGGSSRVSCARARLPA